jgi:hypothetical protein
MQEVLPEEIQSWLEPFGDRANQTELDILQADENVHPQYNLSSTAMEKLDMALGMVEAYLSLLSK